MNRWFQKEVVIEMEDESKIDEIALMIFGGNHDVPPIEVVVMNVHRTQSLQNLPNRLKAV